MNQNFSTFLSKCTTLFIVTIICLLLAACNADESPSSKGSAEGPSEISVEKIPSSKTGISFSNDIKETKLVHYFNWNFIYSGAGVAIGDINNDGLQDIYLAGNMVSDKLYLNKGNWEFEDISKEAGIVDKLWSTGVNMVDVNADGLLDIYVCKNFFLLQESVRKNKLFINNGDNTFTESADKYGLGDTGFSVQASFFDAENDGDLDLYLVNQPMDEYAAKLARPETVAALPYSDKLYINENGKYVDKTDALNFQNKVFGLNASVADFTNDGRTDIYLCNDYYHGDNFYINQGKLKFRDELKERVDHTSFYSMGADVADINQDGWLDFISLDMAYPSHFRSKTNMESMRPDRFWTLVDAGHHYQYAVNNLQLNNGYGYFSEIGHLAGVSNTDWSWSPLFMDLDNDGFKDLVISNGLIHDLRNNDFINKMKSNNQISPDQIVDYVKQNAPSTPISNFMFQNGGELKFTNVTKEAGFDDLGFTSGMAFGDLDNDGNPDLVLNNSNGEASVFKVKPPKSHNYINVTLEGKIMNPKGLGANVEVFYDGKREMGTMTNVRGYMSSSQCLLHYGLSNSSKVDSIVVYWDHVNKSVVKNPSINTTVNISYKQTRFAKPLAPNGVLASNQNIIAHEHLENANDDYKTQVLLPHKLSQNGPLLSKADIDKDGKDDILIGASAGQSPTLFRQSNSSFADATSFPKLAEKESMGQAWFDLEGDGDLDVYIVNGGNQFEPNSPALEDNVFINNGKGDFSAYTGNLSMTQFDGESVIALDIDNDNDQDIIVGGRLIPNAYPKKASSILLINENGVLEDGTSTFIPELHELGLVTDIQSGDFDNDGDQDLVMVGEWMPVTLFLQENGTYTKKSLDGLAGTSWWWSCSTGDFDNDGDLDILSGSLGLNNKFKPSEKKPFKVYSGDFDENGDHDVVLAKTIDDELYPVRGRECSTEEMPFVSEKFEDFESFAKASLVQIIPEEKLSNSDQYSIHSFQSIYLENNGDASFKVSTLPIQAQLSPIKDFVCDDFNNDGHLDFIFAGNHYPAEVETVRYDAGKGGLMLGNGLGQFQFIPPNESGIYIDCDSRDLEVLTIDNQKYLISSCNDGPVVSLRLMP